VVTTLGHSTCAQGFRSYFAVEKLVEYKSHLKYPFRNDRSVGIEDVFNYA